MKEWLQQQREAFKDIHSVSDAINAIGNKAFVRNLPFIFYCVCLGLLFITFEHQYENRSRKIELLSTQVKELNWQFKDEKTKLMFLTKESEIAKRAQDLGLESNIQPPYRLAIETKKK